jgi:hypothetical protein
MAKHGLRAPHIVAHDILQLRQSSLIHIVEVNELTSGNTKLRSAPQLEDHTLTGELKVMVDFPSFHLQNRTKFKFEEDYF